MPSFVVIGTQRGGTTSLYSLFTQVPGFVPAQRKEVHFFDINYERGMGWYRARFPVAEPGIITGEATPYLLYHPLAPSRVARDLDPSVKFVVLLRDPTERAISHYWHERRLGVEHADLETALAREDEVIARAEQDVLRGGISFAHQHFSYKTRGLYAEQLRRWFDEVDRSRLLIYQSEGLFSDPEATRELLVTLGFRAVPDATELPRSNAAMRRSSADPAVVSRLREYYAGPNAELEALLGRAMWPEADT